MHNQRQADKESTWNVVVAFINGYAMTIYLLMRLNVGKRHVGLCGLVGLGWMVLYMMHTRCDDMLILIGIFVVGNTAHKFTHAIGKAEAVHSRYAGDPFLAMKLFPFMSETRAKQFGEPIIAIIAGVVLMQFSDGLGKYFIGGAVFLMMNQAMLSNFDQQRIDDIRDGMIEQHYLMGRVRNRRRE